MRKDYTLLSSEKNKIRITTFGNENIENSNCLILVHGFKGFKDWGFWPYAGNYFSFNDYFVITFNFSHNGTGDSFFEFIELDKFAGNTFSLEISELNQVIDAYFNGFFGKVNNRSKIGIVGHSRGGANTILAASRKKDISAIVTWASISKLDRYTERQKIEWREKGFIEFINQRTQEMMKLDVSLLEDIEQNLHGSLSMENAVKNLSIPFLIIHGEQDLTVPLSEAEELYGWSDKSRTELSVIPASGHTFNITHPFNGTNEQFQSILEKTNKFFKEKLII